MVEGEQKQRLVKYQDGAGVAYIGPVIVSVETEEINPDTGKPVEKLCLEVAEVEGHRQGFNGFNTGQRIEVNDFEVDEVNGTQEGN